MFAYVWDRLLVQRSLESRVKIAASSEDSSLSTPGLMPSGPAALEMLRA